MKKTLAFSILAIFFVFLGALVVSLVPSYRQGRDIASLDGQAHYSGYVGNEIHRK
ncbi:MAG: hypothetical protein KAQ98_11755 [Bacteriovoracaceae bacterium]|nr:hypothetical protein [Bacteriovoracaceae bacterium]